MRESILAAVAFAGCVSLAAASGVKKAAAPVPPAQEIELLDPNVDPTGKPAVVLRPGPGGQQIDIPPAVLVHRFYYTGDRSFQAQLLPGGPVIVAVNHPKTLERVYVPVTLPPGAPRVTYTPHTIRYDYGPQSVSLVFGICGNPSVHYSQSTAVGHAVHKGAANAVAGAKDLVQKTGIKEGMQRFGQGAKSAAGAAAGRVQDLGRAVLQPLAAGAKSLPLFADAETRAVREQERLEKMAEEGRGKLENLTIPRRP